MDPIQIPADLPPLAAALQRYHGIDPHHVLLDERDAAACLDVQPKTLEGWRRSGKEMPFIKLGRTIKYRLSDVLACVERNTYVNSREAMTRDRTIPRQRARRAGRQSQAGA